MDAPLRCSIVQTNMNISFSIFICTLEQVSEGVGRASRPDERQDNEKERRSCNSYSLLDVINSFACEEVKKSDCFSKLLEMVLLISFSELVRCLFFLLSEQNNLKISHTTIYKKC